MFTGNPMNEATDEIVINASWGLGEAVVSGVVTPDTITVAHRDLAILEHEIGAKELRITRDPDAPSGTREAEAPAEDRERPCLTEAQIKQLAKVARRVQDHYEGLPQDIEWAIADEQVYVLQARPITGVEFSWDADVDARQPLALDPDTVWTCAWADEAWTGPTTPLFYSMRLPSLWLPEEQSNRYRGLPGAAELRYMTCYKAKA